jgi:hypothetical protein
MGKPRFRHAQIVAIASATALSLAGAGIIGFMVGSSGAPTQRDAAEAHKEGFRSAFTESRTTAFGQARRSGALKGRERGRSQAKRAGAQGGEDAKAQLAKIAQEEAEAAARAEAEERAANCGAPLFVEGYCPTDEEIERESLAESLCGSGDPAKAEEAEQYGIRC